MHAENTALPIPQLEPQPIDLEQFYWFTLGQSASAPRADSTNRQPKSAALNR